MSDSVKWDGCRVGVDVPATPPDLDAADWLLWATPKTRRGVDIWPDGRRRYYCRSLVSGRFTRAYVDPDRAVAVEHKRAAVGIELNPEYVTLIHKRLGAVQPRLFNL